jgi:hypothetical protein
MHDVTGLARIAVLCGNCSCGCPELFIDHAAAEDRRTVITDDFGQRVQMSADQLPALIEEARSGRLDELLPALSRLDRLVQDREPATGG